MKRTLFLLFIVLINSCQDRIKKDNYKIIDLDTAKLQMKVVEYPSEKVFKNKNQTTLDELEENLLIRILISSINTYNEKHPSSELLNSESYNFFIIPTKDENDKKWVYIFGICNNHSELNIELHQFFLVEDGGNCYIQTVINLTDKYEGWFFINSRA